MNYFSILFLMVGTSSINKLVDAFALTRPSNIYKSPTKLYETVASTKDYNEAISQCTTILTAAAETKTEDPDSVYQALCDLERLMRTKRRAEGEPVGEDMVKNLNGSWRLVFTTGTVKTQEKIKGRINYFPIKAIQSFNTENWVIENAIYAGDFALLKFAGEFEFNLNSCKLEFDFSLARILGIPVPLKRGEAAKIGAASGLGSENNIKRNEQGKKAFFNWICADDNIACARGGGGGLALWKRN